MPWYAILLEYLKLVLAWPVLGSLVIVLTVYWLRRPLGSFLEKVRIRTPGGLEIQTQQPEAKPDVEASTPADQAALVERLSQLESESEQNATEKRELHQFVLGEIRKAWAAAASWEFMYLDQYLVPKTKQMLRLVAAYPSGLTREFIATAWPPPWGDELEREAVLNALQTTGLVEQKGSNIVTITEDKGRAFLQWLDSVGQS